MRLDLENINNRPAILIRPSNDDLTIELEGWDGHDGASGKWRVDRGGVPALAEKIGSLHDGELSPSDVLELAEDLGAVAIAANCRLTWLSDKGESKSKVINPSHRKIDYPGDAEPFYLVERPRVRSAKSHFAKQPGFMFLSSSNPLLER